MPAKEKLMQARNGVAPQGLVSAWERERTADDGCAPSWGARLLLALGKKLHDKQTEAQVAADNRDAVLRFREFLAYFPERPPFTGQRVLEVGAGVGEQTRCLIATDAAAVIAIEPNRILATQLRQEAPSAFVLRADGGRLPLHDGSVQITILQDVLEHVPDPLQLLNEAHRVLVPGGTLLLSLMPWGSPYGAHTWSVFRFPWAHLFYPHWVLAEMRAAVVGWHTTDLGATGLYRLTLRELEAVVQRSGIRVVRRLALGVRQQNWATRIPILRDFATAIIAYHLVS